MRIGDEIMPEKKISGIIGFFESNSVPVFIFITSFFILLTFSGTRLFFSDDRYNIRPVL